MYIPYTSSVIGHISYGSVIQYWRSYTPSRSIGLYFWGVRGSWAECHFCFLWFTNCVLLFDKSLILGCLWPLIFVLKNTLILGIWCSTIPHLSGCFCPWTFVENIGVNTVLTDPFMPHLATQLGYSDCPCGVWCRGLTTCLQHVGPPFGNRIINNSWAVG